MSRKYLLVNILLYFLPFCVLSQNSFTDFFDKAELFFSKHVQDGLVNYKKLSQDKTELDALLLMLNKLDDATQPDELRKAYRINAYNLLVIEKVMRHYPITSVQKVNLFFDKKDLSFAGKKISLNELEKNLLLKAFNDNRLHFVLVCAAASCPPLLSGAYFPDRIEAQLEAQTKNFLGNPAFTKYDSTTNKLELSEIFKWYVNDFGNKAAIRALVQKYNPAEIPANSNITYTPYNWSLNEVKSKAVFNQYKASNLLPVKSYEFKIFNSLYTQRNFDGYEKLNSRSTYFSIYNQFLFGVHPKLSAGMDVVVKSNVLHDLAASSPFKALRFRDETNFAVFPCDGERHVNSLCDAVVTSPLLQDTLRNYDGVATATEARRGLSHLGPKVRFNPVKKWNDRLSLQQTFYIPVDKTVDGSYISFTQFFYDKELSPRTQLFVELSFWLPFAPQFRPLPPFAKAFFSYFPSDKWAFYAMTTLPVEYGFGCKYKIMPRLEVEFLGTWYVPIGWINGGARANTFNIGVLYN